MLPDNRVSALTLPGRFHAPDNERTSLLSDPEMGGIALNDPSLGLKVQKWTVSYQGIDVVVTPEVGSPTVLFSTSSITELSLAFDQNMRAVVAYRKDGHLYLWRWDFVAAGYITSDFGVGYSPRLALDDKRVSQFGSSDVIFAYIQGNELKYRQQRDRYLTERVLRSGLDPATRLRTIGMNRNWRFQFELV